MKNRENAGMDDTTETERTGVLIIRAWVRGPSHELRARLTGTADAGGEPIVKAVGGLDDLVAAVRAWATGLAQDEGSPSQP
jgi:hypothetical protein